MATAKPRHFGEGHRAVEQPGQRITVYLDTQSHMRLISSQTDAPSPAVAKGLKMQKQKR